MELASAGDKGFDALIKHLKAKSVLAARHPAFSEIPVLMNLAERVSLLTAHFKANEISRPRKRKTLESHIQAVFGKILSTGDVADTVRGVVAAKTVSISANEDVTYLPESFASNGRALETHARLDMRGVAASSTTG